MSVVPEVLWKMEMCSALSSSPVQVGFFPRQVKCGSPTVKVFEKEKSYGLPSYVVYTVSLADPRLSSQGHLSTSLSVSSPLTDQSIAIPVTVVYLTDRTSASVGRKFFSGLHVPE